MKKQIAVLAMLAVTAGQEGMLHAAVLPLTRNGVTWDYNYNPNVIDDPELYDKLANASTGTTPIWSANAYSTTGSAAVIEDYLRVTTTGDQGFGYRIATGYAPTAEEGVVTVEMRFRVVSVAEGATNAGSIALGAGNSHFLSLTIGPTSFGSTTGLDLTEWTTVRMTITGATVADGVFTGTPTLTYYINNSTTPSGTSTSFVSTTVALGNSLQFGDLSRSLSQSGVIDWDYVVWTNEGAYAPIPEPATVSLAVITGVGLLLARRRNRSGTK